MLQVDRLQQGSSFGADRNLNSPNHRGLCRAKTAFTYAVTLSRKSWAGGGYVGDASCACPSPWQSTPSGAEHERCSQSIEPLALTQLLVASVPHLAFADRAELRKCRFEFVLPLAVPLRS